MIKGDMESILNRMEIAIDNSVLDESQVAHLRKKLKEFEVSIREKIKPKTITISGSSHRKMKRYCESLNLKIGEWVEKTLMDEIENSSAIIRGKEDGIEKESDALVKKYMDERSKRGLLVKVDKLILDKDFHFRGYSCIDCNPIYEYFGNEKMSDLFVLKFSCKILGMPNPQEISQNFFHESMDIEIEDSFMSKKCEVCGKPSCGEEIGFNLCEEHLDDV